MVETWIRGQPRLSVRIKVHEEYRIKLKQETEKTKEYAEENKQPMRLIPKIEYKERRTSTGCSADIRQVKSIVQQHLQSCISTVNRQTKKNEARPTDSRAFQRGTQEGPEEVEKEQLSDRAYISVHSGLPSNALRLIGAPNFLPRYTPESIPSGPNTTTSIMLLPSNDEKG